MEQRRQEVSGRNPISPHVRDSDARVNDNELEYDDGPGSSKKNASMLVHPSNQGEPIEFDEGQSQDEGLKQFVRILRNGKFTIAACLCLSLAVASTFLLLAPSYYLASATILIQPHRAVDTASSLVEVKNQSQILQSTVVARSVVEKLGIAGPEEIKSDSDGSLKHIARRFAALMFPFETKKYLLDAAEFSKNEFLKGIARQASVLFYSTPTKESSVEATVVRLARNLKVRHVGNQTRVLQVSYRSTDPFRAAKVANAFVEAYKDDAQHLFEKARQDNESVMEQRILAVRRQVEEAELALDEFKSNNVGSISRYRSKLRELETNATTVREMYDVLKQRSIDLTYKPGRKAVSSRLLSRANVPKSRDQPRTTLVLGSSILFGLTMGIGILIFRDFFSSGFRSGYELSVFLRLPVFGELPTVKPAKRKSKPDPSARACAELKGAARLVLDARASEAVDALALAQEAISKSSGSDGPCVIGITSSVDGEGRSTTCLNLATLLSASGNRVLIVDADWKKRGLSKMLSDDPEQGLVQVLFDKLPAADAFWTEPTSGAKFLPAGLTDKLCQSPNSALATATRIALLDVNVRLSELSDGTDFVLVRLPSMSAVPNTTWPVDWLDGILLVARAEKTSPETIAAALRQSPHLVGKIVGGLLTNSRRSSGAVRGQV